MIAEDISNYVRGFFKFKRENNQKGLYPFGARVIVKKTDVEKIEKTASGIIIPETSQEIPANEGIVIAVGDQVGWVKPNDYVYWNKHAGFILRPKGTRFENIYIMQEDDLLGGEIDIPEEKEGNN